MKKYFLLFLLLCLFGAWIAGNFKEPGRVFAWTESDQPIYVMTVGGYTADGLFNVNGGFGIDSDSQGNIYVADPVNRRVQKFDKDGNFLGKFGSYGIEDDHFIFPVGVSIGQDERIYVLDTGVAGIGRWVKVFDYDFNFLFKFGGDGTGDGEFNSPYGITTDSQNNIYVADTWNHRVQVFDSNGNFKLKFGSFGSGIGQLRSPSGIVVDGNGNIYVSEGANSRVSKFDSNGNFMSYFTKTGFRPSGLVLEQSGNLYVAENTGIISIFSSDGSFIESFGENGTGDGQLGNPYGIAIFENQEEVKIYVSEFINNRISVFDGGYNFLFNWGNKPFNEGYFLFPYGIWVDEQENIFIADSRYYRIQKFDRDGNFLMKFGSNGSGDGQFNEPRSVIVDSFGNIYVTDYYNNRVQKFDKDGNFVMKFGSSGSGDGQFNRPSAMFIDRYDNIYVADTYNHRIQKFDSNGSLIMKFGSNGSGDGQFNLPQGITVDNDDNIYVSDTSNNRIQKFDSDGNFLLKFGNSGSGGGQFNMPLGLMADENGFIWVADRSNHRVQKFNNEGVYIMQFGVIGIENGEMQAPVGLDFDSGGNLFVLETTNSRFQKFTFDRQKPILILEDNSNDEIIAKGQIITGRVIDDLTGITVVEYKVGEGVWQQCNGSFDSLTEEFSCDLSATITSDGIYTVYLRAIDSRTNTTEEEITFIYDTTPPTKEEFNSYTSGINVYTGQVVTTNPYIIKVKAVDSLSGVEKVEFFIDENLVCTDTEVNSEGLYECAWDTLKYQTDIRVVMYDRAGNVAEFEVLGVELSEELTRTGSGIWWVIILGVLFWGGTYSILRKERLQRKEKVNEKRLLLKGMK